MKRLKQLFTITASTITCFSSIMHLQSTAISVDKDTLIRYEEYYRFSDTSIIYKTVDENNDTIDQFITPIGDDLYAPLGMDFQYYTLSEAESAIISDYLTVKYPETQLIVFGDSEYELIYNESLSAEERLKVAIDIYENTTLYPILAIAETPNMIQLSRLGDLDSDGTVNALDASNILTYYSDSQTGNTDTYTDEDIADITLLGDYDADGAVNALDASLVLKEYADTQTN